ncbi:MAG TPA: hypothetical protein VFA85_15500 [Terriglobales bacterium]|nr:hypothetical protein [Terriglobales bacterium]
MLAVAVEESRKGLAEGGLPIGAAIFDFTGKLLGSGHNRRIQNGILPYTARLMRSATQAGSEPIATRLWSPRSHRAGIAAVSSASSVSKV